jgi:hypothetical protein
MKRFCDECHNGEIETIATSFITVFDDVRLDPGHEPYTECICEDHLQMLIFDGTRFREERKL